MSRLIPSRIDTLVVSYGGVGTTFLMEFLHEFQAVNDPYDRDGFKHLSVQPISLNRNMKVLYIFGDPVEAVVSLFRRQYHATQSLKLSPKTIPSRSVPFSMSLDQYADRGEDLLQLNQHFDNWRANRLQYSIAFVNYETLWEFLPELFQFFELPLNAVNRFPKRRERKSKLNTVNSKTIEKLERTYAPLRKKLDEVNSFSAISPSKQSLPSHLLQSIIGRNLLKLPFHSALWRAKKVLAAVKRNKSIANEPSPSNET